jgi:hypothetical protein
VTAGGAAADQVTVMATVEVFVTDGAVGEKVTVMV